MRALGIVAGLGLGLSFLACLPGKSASEPIDSLDDALSAQDFDATVRHLSSLPYLPWGYTPDGCYARALYYSMLLATKDIPTNHLYVVAKPGTTLGGQWRWHVAPLITKDGDPNHIYVLDPVYDRTKALTNLEWVGHQDFTDTTSPKYPSLHVRSGTSYLDQFNVVQNLENPAEPTAASYKEPVFSEMPGFEMPDVTSACSRMHQYIDIEPNSTADNKATKHKMLGQETQRLVSVLASKGHITGNPTLPRTCTRGEDAGTAEPAPPAPPVTEQDVLSTEPTR